MTILKIRKVYGIVVPTSKESITKKLWIPFGKNLRKNTWLRLMISHCLLQWKKTLHYFVFFFLGAGPILKNMIKLNAVNFLAGMIGIEVEPQFLDLVALILNPSCHGCFCPSLCCPFALDSPLPHDNKSEAQSHWKLGTKKTFGPSPPQSYDRPPIFWLSWPPYCPDFSFTSPH